ncbi:unnamed protein product [Effrenium voratum]|nr:unnamed protein product [Effrenium voratum]|eukprot:CAMPEP_0181477330 /NCGR_PEP_ID=MMETSP1110-20121109/42161_1 /TAXON_ID=174948 /ORGANISM="Symbiodinium sp., Strain CCMP421" /LENGTH=193 /DNA_ID=CAMNT_0023602629 /DNA_START=43 /DNA_END=624 /DNA_ORIENTATION=+
MGTGGLVVFRSVHGGQTSVYACVYFQCDGYWTSLGVRLGEFLESCVLVNGLGASNPAGRVCNGFDCLVAQFIAAFKTGPGHLYLFPTDRKLAMEFVYVVECREDPDVILSVKTWSSGQPEDEHGAKSMSPSDFRAFCERNGAEAAEGEAPCAPDAMKTVETCEAMQTVDTCEAMKTVAACVPKKRRRVSRAED